MELLPVFALFDLLAQGVGLVTVHLSLFALIYYVVDVAQEHLNAAVLAFMLVRADNLDGDHIVDRIAAALEVVETDKGIRSDVLGLEFIVGIAVALSHERVYPVTLPSLLWAICVVLIILWLLGFSLHVGGDIIHLLLVIALVLVVFNLLSGRSPRV